MIRIHTDILVAGGGIAGMIASLVFADQGFNVTCVDAAPKPSASSTKDLRSTAFLMPSIRLLKEAGIFTGLEEVAAPLQTMRIVDAGGKDGLPRETVDFEAITAGEEQFGWNVPNAALRERLLTQIEKNTNITMIFGDAVDGLTTRMTGAILRLKSGARIDARLVIAADGRASRLRDLAGINTTTYRYGQKALVFQVRHGQAHNGISTEVHRTGGPFTLVPLAVEDQTQSAVVWMTSGAEADRLFSLSEKDFEEAVNQRSAFVMGQLHLTSERGMWPIISQFSDRLTDQRLALIGEAAHVVPPIGAQGLNMSLTDIKTLKDLMSGIKSPQDIGSDTMLDQFQRKRWTDMRLRVQGIDALNRASIAGGQPIRDIRASLLAFLGKSPNLKKTAIKTGLGT